MDYENNEVGLAQLLEGLEFVPGTSPPVYMLDDILIGYDRDEKIKILATRSQLKKTKHHWLQPLLYWSTRLTR